MNFVKRAAPRSSKPCSMYQATQFPEPLLRASFTSDCVIGALADFLLVEPFSAAALAFACLFSALNDVDRSDALTDSRNAHRGTVGVRYLVGERFNKLVDLALA